jgi:hypothetical protein
LLLDAGSGPARSLRTEPVYDFARL